MVNDERVDELETDKPTTVAVIEDDPAIAELLEAALSGAGYQVVVATTGEAGVEAVTEHKADLVLVDIGLPDIDGFEVCRQVRADVDRPVLFLTARRDEIDRIVAFELGADDYVTKPFSLRELVARVRAILRRSQNQLDSAELSVIEMGEDIVLDRSRREVSSKGEVITLATKEYELLEYLARHTGQAITRNQLLSAVWDQAFHGSDRTVDVHVSHLRRKLGDDLPLATVHGLGYRLG